MYTRFIKTGFAICFLFFALGNFVHALDPGFVTEPVWVSPKPEDGKTSTIYATIYNPYEQALVGVVEFFDDTTVLGSKTFSVLPKDVGLVTLAWLPTPGDHSINVRITKTGLQSKQETKKVTVAKATFEAEPFFVSKSTIKPIPQTTKTVSNTSKESQTKTKNSDNDARPQTLSIVDSAQEKIKDILNPRTTLSIENVWDSIDAYREPIYQKIEAKRTALKETLSPSHTDTKNTESTKKGTSTPFMFVSLFFSTLGAIIFSRTSIFVICCILGTILVCRLLWLLYKKIRGNHDQQ
jgi:hypothetical protein